MLLGSPVLCHLYVEESWGYFPVLRFCTMSCTLFLFIVDIFTFYFVSFFSLLWYCVLEFSLLLVALFGLFILLIFCHYFPFSHDLSTLL